MKCNKRPVLFITFSLPGRGGTRGEVKRKTKQSIIGHSGNCILKTKVAVKFEQYLNSATTNGLRLPHSPKYTVEKTMALRTSPIFLFCSLPIVTCLGYGEKIDSLPNWQERAIHVVTNACRMAPEAFRDRFIGNSTILLPENYPPVNPLYYNANLSMASHYHAVEMINGCGMAHDCFGISFSERLRSFYTTPGYIGENIASGYPTPQQTVFGWIIETQSAAQAVPDNIGDGHRKNIMSPNFKELGCGYTTVGTGRNASTYWSQDFGGGTRATNATQVIASATHLFLTAGFTTFWASVYVTQRPVQSVSVIIENNPYPMNLDLGTAEQGTYAVALPTATQCRHYYFLVLFLDNTTSRYPDGGTLQSYGEGTCKEDYAPFGNNALPLPIRPCNPCSVSLMPHSILVKLHTSSPEPVQLSLRNLRGALLQQISTRSQTVRLNTRECSSGLYILTIRNKNSTQHLFPLLLE